MREIKFRGVSVENEKWYYGDLVQVANKKYIYFCSNKIFTLNLHYDYKDTGHLMEEVIPETVGQFTGLKDVNGTEIYEGDILYDDFYYKYYLVKYKDGGFSALPYFDNETSVIDIDLFEVCDDVKVVSNTYEDNKERG